MDRNRTGSRVNQLLSQHGGTSVHGVWHHVLVGELLLVCLRNAGYPISDALLDEVIDRGRQIPGGACGFLGTCGALASAGAAYAIVLGSTPVAVEARERLLNFQARRGRAPRKHRWEPLLQEERLPRAGNGKRRVRRSGLRTAERRSRRPLYFFAANDTCDGAECPTSRLAFKAVPL